MLKARPFSAIKPLLLMKSSRPVLIQRTLDSLLKKQLEPSPRVQQSMKELNRSGFASLKSARLRDAKATSVDWASLKKTLAAEKPTTTRAKLMCPMLRINGDISADLSSIFIS